MFRHKHKMRKPEQLAAKPTYAGSNANTMRNVGGAYGFSAGLTGGIAIGGSIGAGIGIVCGGIPVPFTTLIGMGIGGFIGGGSGAGLGRWVGKKLENKAIEEQKDILGLQAEETQIQKLLEPHLKKELDAISIFITYLIKYKIVVNTRNEFFDQVDDDILSSTQKQLFNAMLDEQILTLQINSNTSTILKWGDSVKATTLLKEVQIEDIKFKEKVKSLNTQYLLDKKNQIQNKIQKNDLNKQHSKNKILNHLITLVLGNIDSKDYLPWVQKLKIELNSGIHSNLFTSCKIIVSDEKEKKQIIRWHGLI